MGLNRIVRRLLVGVVLVCPAVHGEERASTDATQAAIREAHAVMDEFLAAFNARDEARWAETLHFPHVRIASGGVSVVPSKTEFIETTDLDDFARSNNWHHSEWDHIEVVQADPTKVHFKVTFSRFNPTGERYVTFDSLYILQNIDGQWAIRGRSSFAP